MGEKQGLCAALLLIGALGGSGPTWGASFDELDIDRDGLVNPDEASGDRELRKVWSRVDSDASGSVDRTEFSAFEAMRRADDRGEAQPPANNPSAR